MSEQIRRQVPLGRSAEADEIAYAAVASDESLFVVGSELVIDGRMTRI